MSEPEPTYDPLTAYHEAGHAVVALYLDQPVERVSVRPGAGRLGHCAFKKGVARPSDDWVEWQALIALAGPVAEAIHSGRYDWGGGAMDLRTAEKMASMRAGERSVERLLKRWLAKTENTLADEALWGAVGAIAAELLKSGQISGRAARHHFELWQKRFAD